MGTKFYRINKILFIFLILAGVFIIQPVFVSADNLCWDECPSNGQRDESGNQYRICGNYDADTCLEWSDWQQKDNLCWDECPYQGKQECSDSGGYRVCGNYDDDYCLEWSSKTLCSSGTVCQSGECVVGCTSHFSQKCFDNDIYWYDSCGNKEDKIQECGSDYFTNNYRCQGNLVQRELIKKGCSLNSCYSYSQWENQQDCSINGNACNNGSCINQLVPTVNLKANYSDGPITVPYNSSVVLSWSSSNATSCYASGDWSGTKSTSGSETIYNLTSSKTYTLTCTGGGNSSSDTVYVKIGGSSSSTSLLSVKKLVRNITKGSDLSESVLAEPNDVLAFTIEVSAGSSSLSNVIVKDILPEAIKYRQNSLKIDGSTASGDIFSGLNLGSLYQYQHKIISFEADVSSAENFKFGENQFVNIVTVSSSDLSARDTAGITVSRKAVAGAATEIKTGIANNPFLDFFLFPLLIAAIIVWLFRSHIIRIDEWVNSQKIKYQDYKAKKILNLKIAQIKKQKIN